MPAQKAATIFKPLVPNPHPQPLLDMVQHVADWVVTFPRRQHSPHPPQILPHSTFTSLLSLRARELETIIIIS